MVLACCAIAASAVVLETRLLSLPNPSPVVGTLTPRERRRGACPQACGDFTAHTGTRVSRRDCGLRLAVKKPLSWFGRLRESVLQP